MGNRQLLGASAALAVALSGAGAGAADLPVKAPTKTSVAQTPGPGTWYVGVEGGLTSLPDQSGPAQVPALATIFERFDNGYNVGMRVGYDWGSLRVEEEFRYQYNGIPGISDRSPVQNFVAKGSRSAYALMTNTIYDFTFGWPLTPHIGAGIGAVGLRDEWVLLPGGRCDDAVDWVFGYQVIAGVRYNITASWSLDVDYRYLATTKPTFVLGGNGAIAGGVAGTTFTSGYATQSVVASLSRRF